MLQLRNITKDYRVGDTSVSALKGVSLSFRRNEFVSILGASGCGKTTLLNIIGGLDQYTSGDLIIEGTSTKDYNDGDWDTYRNHRIGFVFQSYNLIPHQTILGNVELALTLSGVSAKERKARATEALRRVGLGGELNKRPNQLSGGQMQRVAIARALVNNPEILLADEPTGALDTNTSVQIMDLIKEIAGERLVIMVTHNPELAYKYSTRIVELKDGLVVSDSAPYSPEEEEAEVKEHLKEVQAQESAEADKTQAEPSKQGKKSASYKGNYKKKHSSMSVVTAFFLSGKNLLTKKARTLITAVAGSIGIISVCLVLALSNGFNNYIGQTEEDMLSYYPVTVAETSIDLTSAMSSFMNGSMNLELDKVEDKVYVNSFLSQLAQGMTTTNDFTEDNVAEINGKKMTYLEYLEAMPEELYNAIQYSYGVSISGNLFADVEIGSSATSEGETTPMHMSLDSLREYYTYLLTYKADEFSNLTQFVHYFTDVVSVMPDTDLSDSDRYGDYVLSQYDVIAGEFPQSSDEVVLVVGGSNDVIDLTLVQLGFMTETEFLDLFISSEDGVSEDEEPASIPFYDEYDEDGNLVKEGIIGKEYTLYYNDAVYKPDRTGLSGYNYIYSGYSEAKEDEPPVSAEDGRTLKISGILRLKDGLTYGCLSDGLCITESLLTEYIAQNMQSDIVKTLNDATDSTIINKLVGEVTFEDIFQGQIMPQAKYSSTSTTMPELIRLLGGNDTPSGISVYAKDFNTKEDMLSYMDAWNSAVEKARSAYYEENGTYDGYDGPTEVSYSDTVGTLMGMVNTILDAITYVLVAFTAISLVVSTVMIGVITYVSVVERTKEIGILRSIGARKRDIRHVFNAETFIIGLCAGLIGILVAYLLQGLINLILTPLTGIAGLAALPVWQAIIMVCISVILTLISGLIPASAAAKKDPVIALRTE